MLKKMMLLSVAIGTLALSFGIATAADQERGITLPNEPPTRGGGMGPGGGRRR